MSLFQKRFEELVGEDSREKEPLREYKDLGGRNNEPITMADSKKNEHLETPRSQKKISKRWYKKPKLKYKAI